MNNQICSMTGYGYREIQDESAHMLLEMKSYNNRYLDIFTNLPPFLNPLEPKIREFVSSRIKRGRVEVNLRMRELEENLTVHLDKDAAKSYGAVLEELRNIVGVSEDLKLGHFLKMDGVLKVDKNRDLDQYWLKIEPLLKEVFTDYDQSRKIEGDALKKDILDNLNKISDSLSIFKSFSDQLEQRIKDNLTERFTEMLGDETDMNRVYTETAVMLVKYTISEEIVRMDTHIKRFKEILETGKGVGKKLDFLCQELNREINTVGSKSIIAEVNHSVVEAKDSLENIREQLRNVE